MCKPFQYSLVAHGPRHEHSPLSQLTYRDREAAKYFKRMTWLHLSHSGLRGWTLTSLRPARLLDRFHDARHVLSALPRSSWAGSHTASTTILCSKCKLSHLCAFWWYGALWGRVHDTRPTRSVDRPAPCTHFTRTCMMNIEERSVYFRMRGYANTLRKEVPTRSHAGLFFASRLALDNCHTPSAYTLDCIHSVTVLLCCLQAPAPLRPTVALQARGQLRPPVAPAGSGRGRRRSVQNNELPFD